MKKVLKLLYKQMHSAKSTLAYRALRQQLVANKQLDVPYFCQWESPELAATFLKDPAKTSSDPRWKHSGASSRQEYALWSWNLCGMACLKMILESLYKKSPGIIELGKAAESYGAYKLQNGVVEGMFYKPFVKFAGQEYQLQARVISPMHPYDIIKALSANRFVIASVSPEIRHPKSQPAKTGGHLVLVTGYDLNKEQFTIHNPSGNSMQNQANTLISFNDFRRFFSGRGLILYT